MGLLFSEYSASPAELSEITVGGSGGSESHIRTPRLSTGKQSSPDMGDPSIVSITLSTLLWGDLVTVWGSIRVGTLGFEVGFKVRFRVGFKGG